MAWTLNRRDFLTVSASAGVAALAAPHGAGAEAAGTPPLKKAVIRGVPDQALLETLVQAGFHGMECNAWDVDPARCEKARQAAAATGASIHSVLRGWCSFNHDDAERVEKDIESVRTALRTASDLGAGAVLLVPCKVSGGPKPWEFDYEVDEETLMVRRVVAGDNTPYRDYIEAQNRATRATREAVAKLVPEAEKRGVVIALENVWNNLWVKPEFFTALVNSFTSPWVQAYLDLGNHVKYAPTPEWIHTLGAHIARCHVKDFKLKADGRGGSFVDIRDGSNDWPAIRQALGEVGYQGWMTIEGSGGLSLSEQSRRLDRIIAGT